MGFCIEGTGGVFKWGSDCSCEECRGVLLGFFSVDGSMSLCKVDCGVPGWAAYISGGFSAWRCFGSGFYSGFVFAFV